jgi:hypothetical protein
MVIYVVIHFLEPSPYLAKAICLRGTMHTLMSMYAEALQDFDRVIHLEDAAIKVNIGIRYLKIYDVDIS